MRLQENYGDGIQSTAIGQEVDKALIELAAVFTFVAALTKFEIGVGALCLKG